MDYSSFHQVIYLRHAHNFVIFLFYIKLRPDIYIYTYFIHILEMIKLMCSPEHMLNILYTIE